MKFCRFLDGLAEKKGIVDGEIIREIEGSFFGEYVVTDRVRDAKTAQYLPPVYPSKLVCVARNYAEHAKELGNEVPEVPMIFIKPSTAVTGHGGEVVFPRTSQHVDYEGELAVVIGQKCRKVKREHAESVIFGYTCINDYTARDLQKLDGKFARAKGFDTFAPIGPVIETDFDWKTARIKTFVNGELKQNGTTDMMINDVPALIEFMSEIMTLMPGDIIATGTPAGIGSVKPGDVVEVEIDGIGRLTNTIVKDGK
ncbi:fumarylacetoacetate hydrolase family protein [Seleniivibrio woodruffii]|uniref:fumarylacetoacetate hydrolase family protein n=1 Tax=Seleniivibrio woodruffii TaxID=1078050 RepID=UPI0026EAB4A4|nr:fumarylacetoacetate hydrolase family protein [Seleniivibrio woodruffii]